MRRIKMQSGISRWMFNFTNWTPTASEWMSACSFIEPEETEKVQRFVFKKDAKATMAGRLMTRQFFQQALGTSSSSLRFGRTEKGKPFLEEPGGKDWHFNVSHSGDFVVFAALKDIPIGIDVMKVEYPRRKSVPDYFQLMRSQFTAGEWLAIERPAEEPARLRNFYRLWCLKESYVKALGVGIGYNVSKLDFHLPPSAADAPDESITLQIDGTLQKDWLFREYQIGEDHVGAIAVQYSPERLTAPTFFPEEIVKELRPDDLVKGLDQLWQPEKKFGEDYFKKPERP